MNIPHQKKKRPIKLVKQNNRKKIFKKDSLRILIDWLSKEKLIIKPAKKNKKDLNIAWEENNISPLQIKLKEKNKKI